MKKGQVWERDNGFYKEIVTIIKVYKKKDKVTYKNEQGVIIEDRKSDLYEYGKLLKEK